MTADRFIALALTDPAKSGLAAPKLTLTLTLADGTPAGPLKLVVGTPDAGGFVARAEGAGVTPALFVVPAAVVALADKPALDYPDKALLAADPTKATKLTIAASDAAANVTLTQSGASWVADGFPVDGPTAAAVALAACKPRIAALAGYGPGVKWADFGLDPATATVAVTLDNSPPQSPATHTIKLGKAAPDGGRYVRVDDGPAVGVVPAAVGAVLASTKLDFVDKTLLAFDPAKLSTLTRVVGKETLELTRTDAGWDVTKPAKLKADTLTADDLADRMGKLRALRAAAFAPADLGPFGLNDSAAVLTLAIPGSAVRVLRIGGPVEAGKPAGDRFTQADGSKVVGVLPAAAAAKLLAPVIQFRDKTLAKFVDADSVTIVRGDRTASFTKAGGTWAMTSPVKAPAEQAELDDLVNALADLRADEWVADGPKELAPFGLSPPAATLTLAAGDKPVLTLLVGAAEANGPRLYAKTAAGPLVAKLDAALSGRVLAEYRKRAVWDDVDAAQVTGLVVSAAGGNFVLNKDGAAWRDPAKPADQIDAAKITELLATFANLKAERYAADADAKLEIYGLAKPGRVIIVSTRNGPTRTLHLGGPEGASGGKKRYAKVADPARPEVFVLSAADVEVLTRPRAAFGAKK